MKTIRRITNPYDHPLLLGNRRRYQYLISHQVIGRITTKSGQGLVMMKNWLYELLELDADGKVDCTGHLSDEID
jgi:hypothetical protein